MFCSLVFRDTVGSLGPRTPREKLGTLKNHTIRNVPPGGTYCITATFEGSLVYAVINAGPLGVSGKEIVRWTRPDRPGSLVVTMWRQKDGRITTATQHTPKPTSEEACIRTYNLSKICSSVHALV